VTSPATTPGLDLVFPHSWRAQILPSRPAILPARHFTYPAQAEEVERGALEVLISPESSRTQSFLATCALGFRDPAVPTGLWSTPNPEEICAVSGGYAYIIHTKLPERFTMVPYRPVLEVRPALAANLLLFVSHRTILAWGAAGQAWESGKLSDEGITITAIEPNIVSGLGWHLLTDKETPFALDLSTGLRTP
jgi:hypothetical protein